MWSSNDCRRQWESGGRENAPVIIIFMAREAEARAASNVNSVESYMTLTNRAGGNLLGEYDRGGG